MSAVIQRAPGVVVGLRAEARIVASAARRTHGLSNGRCAFGDPADLAALVEAGVPALVSFGLAGGLDPRHAPGTLVLADAVVLPDGGVVATDSFWRERVRAKFAGRLTPVVAPIAGSNALIDSPAAKASLRRQTDAAAVDMESHTVARAARQAGLAFLVLRAVADSASDALPPAVQRGFTEHRRLSLAAVFSSLLLTPSQVPDLVRLARDAQTGFATLRRAVDALGARFGFEEILSA